ncbi:hypothetical protein [Asaia astilbis]|uniref:hypothetical protein n=1 Tax=Asaia astilbis TaxID=610244 RepID=UPI00056A67D5|nr:hypothetical protein [Asaia astilbis]
MSAADDFLRSVRVDGEKLDGLYDQWIPQEVIALADDIQCLTLTDTLSGRQAVWYLDGERNYCGSHIEVVQRLHPQQILSTVAPWFDDLVRHSLSSTPHPVEGAPEMPFFLAAQLAAAWSVRTLGDLRQIQTSLAGQDQEFASVGGRVLSARQIRRILGTRIGPESLIVLSPLTDKPLKSQVSFLAENQLIHRFYDAEAGCTFYLSWWERQLDKAPTFYCPLANLIVSDEGMAGMLPSVILGWYLSHPEHVTVIAEALAFEARDYGLGNASSLQIDKQPEKGLPPAPAAASAEMISESWAFLHRNPSTPAAEPTKREEQQEKKSGRLFDRLRSLVNKS